MNVKVTNPGDDVVIAGITFANGDNEIDHETLALMTKLGVLTRDRYPAFSYDLSALEGP